jgi:hypothetical protein
VFYTGRARSASRILADQSAGISSNRRLLRRMFLLAFDMKIEL